MKGWVQFLLCVLLSAGFWLVLNLSQDYVALVSVPVVAESNIEGRAAVSTSEATATAQVSASGFRQLVLSRRHKRPVQVVFAELARNLSTFRYDREKGRFRSYLAGLVNWRVVDRLKSLKREADLKADFWEEARAANSDDDFAEREWQAAAMEEALRRMKPDVRPEHYAAFVASAVEGQDTETVMRLYGLSRDNLYQIRTRLTAKLRETVAVVLAEMDDPSACSGRI